MTTAQAGERGERGEKNYWYFKHITMCPVCQKEKVELERKYTPKPLYPYQREAVLEVYDWCNE